MALSAAGAHGFYPSLTTREQGEDIGVDHFSPLIRFAVDDGAGIFKTGVVHHDVQPFGLVQCPLHKGGNAARFINVDAGHARSAAGFNDKVSYLIEGGLGSANEVYMRTFLT